MKGEQDCVEAAKNRSQDIIFGILYILLIGVHFT